MGIDPTKLTDRQRALMDPAQRKELGIDMHQSASPRRAIMLRTLERDEQRTLANWLKLREDDGILVYDWSRMDRRSTGRKGMPDFRLYMRGRTLLGEMKVGGAGLSPDQVEMMEKFGRSGTPVQVWRSASEGIEKIRDWLMSMPA